MANKQVIFNFYFVANDATVYQCLMYISKLYDIIYDFTLAKEKLGRAGTGWGFGCGTFILRDWNLID
jgi:hypothetical protein